MEKDILDKEELEKGIEEKKKDSNVDLMEGFYDYAIGKYPKKELIKRGIEGELLHQQGIGSLLTFEEVIEVICREWVDDNIVFMGDDLSNDANEWLENNRQELVNKVYNKVYDNVIDKAEKVYKEIIINDISEKDPEEIYSIGDEINRLNKENKMEEVPRSEVNYALL